MTRINGTAATGPQQIPSQDSNSQQVSKPGSQSKEPTATELQQGKQAAQGRKSDIDLQGTIKQSQLAMFHGPGGGQTAQKASFNGTVEKMPAAADVTEDYPIVPSSKNQLHESVNPVLEGSWPNYTVKYPTKGYREANSEGLQQRLKDLNNGQPLTDFEKQWVAKWDKQDIDTDFTPILIVGEKGVQAYKITQGGTDNKVVNYYDREGNKLAGPLYPSGAGLVNEGLGPIEYLIGGLAAKKVLGSVISRARSWAAAEGTEAAAAATARTEGDAIATGAGKTLKEGSGTSIYEFSEAEEEAIKKFQDLGMAREEAEDIIRRRGQESVEVIQPGVNASGTTRLPDWKNPGPGKHRP